MVFFTVLILWLISLCLHEYAHARVAFAGGDFTVESKGYLSLNPLRYVHPMMSIGIPLIILAVGGIPLPGGAVYIETARLRSKAWQSAVSAAGPAANLALLGLVGLAFETGLLGDAVSHTLPETLAFFGFLMAYTSVINLLPVPGLDGFGIIEPHLPREIQLRARELGNMLILLLLFALLSPKTGLSGYLSNLAAEMTHFVGIPLDRVAKGFELFGETLGR